MLAIPIASWKFWRKLVLARLSGARMRKKGPADYEGRALGGQVSPFHGRGSAAFAFQSTELHREQRRRCYSIGFSERNRVSVEGFELETLARRQVLIG